VAYAGNARLTLTSGGRLSVPPKLYAGLVSKIVSHTSVLLVAKGTIHYVEVCRKNWFIVFSEYIVIGSARYRDAGRAPFRTGGRVCGKGAD
jgi:hypothetical protein